MVEERLADYVVRYRKQGYSESELEKHLRGEGWSVREIKEALLVARSQSVFLTGRTDFPSKTNKERLTEFVFIYRKQGYSREAIYRHLLEQGWNPREIKEAFLAARSQSIFLTGRPGFPNRGSRDSSSTSKSLKFSSRKHEKFLTRGQKRAIIASLVILILAVIALFLAFTLTS